MGHDAAASDPRLDSLINLRKDRFRFIPPETPEAWSDRAERLRLQVQVAAGLWPPPQRPEPRATVHRRMDREGYTVEAVSLEGFPGVQITGSLYKPAGKIEGRRPAVLCPHGHWSDGRFHRWDDDTLAKQVAMGAEHDDASGRHPLQARCVHLARMGCVVFMYDMLGYADSRQFSHIALHAPSEETILDDPDAWGFYSTQAELRLQGPLGVQAYNSQCVFDWLASLEEVDPERIAVTGGSSGATQTLMLCAIDPRPVAAFPVVMVSNAMQGGCGCENACCLRIGTSNVEIAALMAPKPLGMASADDWTKNFEQDGWPEMQQLYTLLGARDRVTHASLIQFPHNYNRVSRAAMYAWLGPHLGLVDGAPPVEADFVPLTPDEASVWDTSLSAAESNDRSSELDLMRTLDSMSREQMVGLTPKDPVSLDKYREVIGGALEVLLCGAGEGHVSDRFVSSSESVANGVTTMRGVIRNNESGIDLPATLSTPREPKRVMVIASALGKRAVADDSGRPMEIAQRLIDRGWAVLGVDLFAQGDLAPAYGPLEQMPVVPEQRPVPSLTLGYNRSGVAHRAGDLLAALVAAKQVAPTVCLVSLDESAPYAVAALAVAGDTADGAVIQSGGYRFAELTSWRDPQFLPGAVKYGDLPGMLALSAPRPTVVLGDAAEIAEHAYQAAGATDSLIALGADYDLADAFDQLQALLEP